MSSRTAVPSAGGMDRWRIALYRRVKGYMLAAILVLVVGVAFAQNAIDDLRSAAQRGDAGAQLALARAYFHGDGVPRNYAVAVRWATLAAERGEAQAQILVAVAYLSDNFAKLDALMADEAFYISSENLIAAYAWLTVAAVRDAEAREWLDDLEGEMTAEQIADGQRMAGELWERIDTAERPQIESLPDGRDAYLSLESGASPSVQTPIPAPLPTLITPGRNRGYFTYDDGSTYDGEFENGKVHGKGTYTWGDGTTYEGTFESGLPHGEGRLTWPTGATYEGAFYAGLMSGTGLMTWSTGATYEGNFTADHIHGRGTLTWPDGQTYSGDFVYETIEGSGVLKSPDGTVYEGNFVRGNIEGSGSMSWPWGDMYVGGFMDGEPHGEGVYTWASGSRFVGAYEYGLAVGGLFYATDNDGKESIFFASQGDDGTWIIEHPQRQLDHRATR